MLFSAGVSGRSFVPRGVPADTADLRWPPPASIKLAFQAHGQGDQPEKDTAGPVVVCSVSYEPIAGHRASIQLVKYLSEGREMEMALAPIAGTRLLAPFQLSVVSTLANLTIEANRLEMTAPPLDASPVADPKAR
jgi:hypothetical protein